MNRNYKTSKSHLIPFYDHLLGLEYGMDECVRKEEKI